MHAVILATVTPTKYFLAPSDQSNRCSDALLTSYNYQTDYEEEMKYRLQMSKFAGVRRLYRVAQKLSHYQELSLDRIKTASEAVCFINFEYKMSTIVLSHR